MPEDIQPSAELIEKLKAFRAAAHALSDAWARNEVPERFGCAGYADVFDGSFDEWCVRLDGWVETTLNPSPRCGE